MMMKKQNQEHNKLMKYDDM